MAKATTRWSFALDRRLKELAGSGKSLDAIADLMKRPPTTVRKMAMRLGVSVKASRLGK
jgi:hypothetical protein